MSLAANNLTNNADRAGDRHHDIGLGRFRPPRQGRRAVAHANWQAQHRAPASIEKQLRRKMPPNYAQGILALTLIVLTIELTTERQKQIRMRVI
jgi:hypothetical protein